MITKNRIRPYWPATWVVSAFALLLVVGCPPPKPKPPGPESGGAGPFLASCAQVCDHWRALGCQEGETSPGGATCEAVCENVQGSGIVVWDLDCMAAVESCADIDACNSR